MKTPISVEKYLTYNRQKQTYWFKKHPDLYPEPTNPSVIPSAPKPPPTLCEFLKMSLSLQSYYRRKYPDMNYPMKPKSGGRPHKRLTREEFDLLISDRKRVLVKSYPEFYEGWYVWKKYEGTVYEGPAIPLEEFLTLPMWEQTRWRKAHPGVYPSKQSKYAAPPSMEELLTMTPVKQLHWLKKHPELYPEMFK